MILAVDFDGTLCESAWPEIGRERAATVDYIRYRKRVGDRIILWTNREGEALEKALEWCKAHGLAFDAVNENLDWVKEKYGDSRKIFADEYIDDKAVDAKAVERQWRRHMR